MVLDHLAEDQIRFLARWALSINDLQLSDGLLPGDLLASMAMAVWRCGNGWVALLVMEKGLEKRKNIQKKLHGFCGLVFWEMFNSWELKTLLF